MADKVDKILQHAVRHIAQLRCCPGKENPCEDPELDKTCACYSERDTFWNALDILADAVKAEQSTHRGNFSETLRAAEQLARTIAAR